MSPRGWKGVDCNGEILKELVGLVGIRNKDEETFPGCSTKRLSTREEGEEDEGVDREGFDSGCLGGAESNVGGGLTKKGEV